VSEPLTAADIAGMRAVAEEHPGVWPFWLDLIPLLDIAALAVAATPPALDVECPHCVMEHQWPCPTIQRCDEPGCEREATCGWPSRPGGTGPNGGYRRTCGEHMRNAILETP